MIEQQIDKQMKVEVKRDDVEENTVTRVFIRTTSQRFVQSLNPGKIKCEEIAHDLNVFFATQGLNFVAMVFNERR